MLTVRNLIEEVKKITNEYSIQGDVVPDDNLNNTDIFDYRVMNFINIALLKIFKEYYSSSVKIIPVFPIKSLIDSKTIQHLNEDIEIEVVGVVKSVVLNVIGNAEIILKKITSETEEIIERIQVNKNSLIKRKINVSNNEKLVIVLAGDYPYLVENIGAYEIDFENTSDIPENKKYQEVELPKDILRINDIKFETKGIEFNFADYIFTSNVIKIPKKYKGMLKIIYYRLPQNVPTDSTNFNYNQNLIIDCPQACEDCLIYYVASMCMKNYDNQLSILLHNEAEIRLSRTSIFTNNHNTKSEIADIRGW
jgi:hypothetical protein